MGNREMRRCGSVQRSLPLAYLYELELYPEHVDVMAHERNGCVKTQNLRRYCTSCYQMYYMEWRWYGTLIIWTDTLSCNASSRCDPHLPPIYTTRDGLSPYYTGSHTVLFSDPWVSLVDKPTDPSSRCYDCSLFGGLRVNYQIIIWHFGSWMMARLLTLCRNPSGGGYYTGVMLIVSTPGDESPIFFSLSHRKRAD